MKDEEPKDGRIRNGTQVTCSNGEETFEARVDTCTHELFAGTPEEERVYRLRCPNGKYRFARESWLAVEKGGVR